METQARGVASDVEFHADRTMQTNGDVGQNRRRYRSPNRVLARSMRMSRDNWKTRHQAVQEKLEQERQLSAVTERTKARYVLSLGALVGDWTTSGIKEALETTPVKLVEAWCKELLPTSVQAQRRLAIAPHQP